MMDTIFILIIIRPTNILFIIKEKQEADEVSYNGHVLLFLRPCVGTLAIENSTAFNNDIMYLPKFDPRFMFFVTI
jgi:hypothetical protein